MDTAGSRGGTRERPAVKGNDFTAPEDFEAEIEKGGQKTKYRKNVAAVKLLKTLEAENRAATPAEKVILAQYTGWGHTPQAFVLTYEEPIPTPGSRTFPPWKPRRALLVTLIVLCANNRTAEAIHKTLWKKATTEASSVPNLASNSAKVIGYSSMSLHYI